MAKAPTPGSARVKRARDEARTGLAARMRITVGDESRTLHLADLGPRDAIECRKATGMPYTAFLQDLSSDSFVVLWWLAERHDGQPNLPFQRVLDGWPSDAELAEMAAAGRVTLEQLDPDDNTDEGDSPEA